MNVSTEWTTLTMENMLTQEIYELTMSVKTANRFYKG